MIVYTGRAMFTLAVQCLHWPCNVYTGRAMFTLAMQCLHWPCNVYTGHAMITLAMQCLHWPCNVYTGHAMLHFDVLTATSHFKKNLDTGNVSSYARSLYMCHIFNKSCCPHISITILTAGHCLVTK